MPKGLYGIMRRYMPKVGGYGLEMMFRTCTVQGNFDFSSEADMVKKFRVGLALQPVATARLVACPRSSACWRSPAYRQRVPALANGPG